MKITLENALKDYILCRKHSRIHIKKYIGQGRSVEIPRFIDDFPVTKICCSAFADSDITDIIIPDGVRIISTFAFYNCKKLRKITLQGRIDECCYAFFNSSVEEIKGIEYLVSSGDLLSMSFTGTPFYENNKTFIIGDRLVWCHDNSKLIRIPDYVKRIGYCAFRDSEAEKIILPEKLEQIGNLAFLGAQIREIYIPDSVRKFGGSALSYCLQLKEIRLPKDFGRRAEWSACLGISNLKNYIINDTQLYANSDDDILEYENVSCITNSQAYLFNPVRLRKRQIFPERLEYLKCARILVDARVNVFRNDTFKVEKSQNVFGLCMWGAVNFGRRVTLIFDFDDVYSEVIFWFPFVPFVQSNFELIKKSSLLEFYEKCLVNADDGRFFDFSIYDEHILQQNIPFRIKAEITYKRLKSRYRLTDSALHNYKRYFYLHRKKLKLVLDKSDNDDMKNLFHEIINQC